MPDSVVLTLPLPDASARSRIGVDLETNLLVEAGAGSGKTTELVSRMVALVESGAARVEELAAVTFTRKAAAELRERFQIRLEKRIREEAPNAERGSDHELGRLRVALDDIDRIFIGTIHSFCARLLRERPLEVGLDPAFQELPVEERVALRNRFWEAYLERLTRDAEPILEDLAAAGLGPSKLSGLFEKVVENPDVEFPTEDAELPEAHDLDRVRTNLEALVAKGIELMPEHQPPADWDSLQKKIRTLNFTHDVTGWRAPAELFEALALICRRGTTGHGITQNRWRTASLAVAYRDQVNAFAHGDTAATRLLDRWYTHRYALAIRLVRAAAEEFAAYRKRVGKLDFQDLLVLTARLLNQHEGVRRQLGSRYRRILIDEFQDTDPLQAEIMMLLSSDPVDRSDWRVAVPRPGALFVVGDPKQSIYRFRRADIQLYGFVKRRFEEFGAVLRLTTNFRSRPPIGDLVNEHFNGPPFFPEVATLEQAAFEPLNTRPAPEVAPTQGVFWYGVHPDADRRESAASDDAERLGTWIGDRVASGERSWGDFMILTRNKAYLGVYARALEARSIPIQVTGAGIGVEYELRELGALLECMIDPTNPVKVVAVLVGLFFGIDYDRLVEHRMSGGTFDVNRPREDGDPEVQQALRVLLRWWRAASTEAADIFVARIAGELGLLPFAASGELGELRAGAFVYALDAVRSAALGGDASLPGALAALRSALELAEAEAPLEPGRPDVVRLMNLHQAKGLEATVVVLADAAGASRHEPDIHTERSEDGHARGYLRVTEASGSWGGATVLALPRGWEEKARAEARFEAAEEARLLYVAVTRAKEELLVARWVDAPTRQVSPWEPLHAWLDDRAERLYIEARPPEPRELLALTPDEARSRTEEAGRTLESMRQPSYRHTSVSELAKGAAGVRASRQKTKRAEQEAELRGYSWGSAVHGALAAAAAGAVDHVLAAACRDLLVEHERPLDDHGDPAELDELVELVRKVLASDLWLRAHRSDQVLSEVPFSVPVPATVLGRGSRTSAQERDSGGEGNGKSPSNGNGKSVGSDERRQLDLFGAPVVASAQGDEEQAAPTEPTLTILEGVIDLAFREADGWVIADYKTDVGTDPDFPVRLASYRHQVNLYADAWMRLTGEPVKERVLLFTAQERAESW